MTFEELSTHCQGKIIQLADPGHQVFHLLTDSRQAIIRTESVFFAIRGEHHDGHQFIQSLYEQGCRQFVVEEFEGVAMHNVNICQVNNSILALQEIVIAHRHHFSLPVIGITGSNGKTIVKEWLSQLLAAKYQVVKNPKSYNSQIGVPLSVWQLNSEHKIGVFEAGISLPGEMKKLQKLIEPEIGIFTNLGPAHDKGFENRIQKAREKAILFKESKIVIYRKEYEEVDQVLSSNFADNQLFTWSTLPNSQANIYVDFTTFEIAQTQIIFSQAGKPDTLSLKVPFKDEASLENVVHCIVFLLYQRWGTEAIQNGLEQLRQVKMRMELKEGINHCTLLDDSYSNDLAGLKIALSYLQRQSQHEKHTVILSDLLESGFTDENLYAEVIKLLHEHAVNKLIFVGKRGASYLQPFEDNKHAFQYFPDTEAYLETVKPNDFRDENILIKGARTFGFEKIVRKLQQKITGTTLEINLDAIIHNLHYIRSLLSLRTKMMVMVKAFSYGGAAFEIANLLQYHRVDYLAVAYVDEGVMLRKHGINTPILVLNPTETAFPLMMDFNLEPEIYSLKLLEAWVAHTSSRHNSPDIHLKIDTGMHRLGFVRQDVDSLALFLMKYTYLKIGSIFSHLVASEDDNEDDFTLLQTSSFEQMYTQITQVLGYYPLKHLLNSGGIQRFPQFQFDMVRLGIGLYGVDVTRQAQSVLRPVSTLKTIISQIKTLQVGETVGYNRKGKIEKTTKIATIAIGYADGLDRRLGNGRLKVWVNGHFAPTIGNICMDMSMVDISGIMAQEGDEVIIFGEQQSVTALSAAMQTIPYEVLTGISARVKRVFFSET